MSETEEKLIRQAQELYREVFPCSNKTDLKDCFTRDRGRVLLWFNTSDKSTHLLSSDVVAV